MMFFLSKLWIWWLVAALVAGVVAAVVCHYWPARRRKPVVDERQVRALADARAAAGKHEAKVNELLALRAKDLDELTTLRAKVDSVDTLSRRIKQLEAGGGDTSGLEATIATLRAEGDDLRAEADDLRARVVELESAPAADADGAVDGRVEALQAEADKVGPLQDRVAELEAAGAQVAGLQARVTELEGESAELGALRSRLGAAQDELGAYRSRIDGLEVEAGRGRDAQAELSGMQGRVRELEATATRVAELQARIAELEAELRDRASNGSVAASTQTALLVGANDMVVEGSTADVSGAFAVLRSRIKPDDLKVVEGIGPKIAQLLQAAGITSWRALADADTSTLRAILDAAGARFQIHDPSTWPRQAELLANGEWAAFKALTEELKGGRVAR